MHAALLALALALMRPEASALHRRGRAGSTCTGAVLLCGMTWRKGPRRARCALPVVALDANCTMQYSGYELVM